MLPRTTARLDREASPWVGTFSGFVPALLSSEPFLNRSSTSVKTIRERTGVGIFTSLSSIPRSSCVRMPAARRQRSCSGNLLFADQTQGIRGHHLDAECIVVIKWAICSTFLSCEASSLVESQTEFSTAGQSRRRRNRTRCRTALVDTLPTPLKLHQTRITRTSYLVGLYRNHRPRQTRVRRDRVSTELY